MDFVEQHQVNHGDVLGHWYYQAKFGLLCRTLDRAGILNSETRLADIGCGIGLFLTLLEKSGRIPAGQMLGIDPAAAEGSRSAGGSVRVVQAVPGGAFDVVLLMDVLEHVDDDRALLESALEQVAPGGHVFITVPAFRSLWSRHDELLGHRRRYTRDSLGKLIATFPGLRVRKLHYFYALILPPAALVRWLRRGATGSGTDMAPCHPVLNRVLTFLLGGEARIAGWNRLAGLSVVAFCQKELSGN